MLALDLPDRKDFIKMNAERIQAAAILQQQAEAVAAALGWRYLPPTEDMAADCWAHLKSDNGAGLTFNFDSWKKRVRISGDFPPNYHPYGKSFEITVGQSRPASAVAKDITRRLLPTYLPAIAQALERKAKSDEACAVASALAAELAKLVGGEVLDPRNAHSDERHAFRRYENLYVDGTVSAYGDCDVRLKIDSCSAALARILMRTIHQFFERPEPARVVAPKLACRTLWGD
jgi:hypothetical protein